MKKSLLFLLLISYMSFAQNLDIPSNLYLCQNGSISVDGTVTNTTDTGITYQWYYSTSSNVEAIPANEIAGATNPVFSVTTNSNGVGFYRVVATLTNSNTLNDKVHIYDKNNLNAPESVECMDIIDVNSFTNYWLLQYTSNITYYYYEFEYDALQGNEYYGGPDFFYTPELYLRIVDNNGQCDEVSTIHITSLTQPLYAYSTTNMGSCSPNSTNNVFDLTTKNSPILSGQNWAEVSYFTDYNDAWNIQNPIANPISYTALSPNQTIYARVYDPNSPNNFCEVHNSITQFQLLSAPEPTPNTNVNYIVCDNTSGADNDGIGLFNLPSRNPLVLSGLNTSQFAISYHETLTDAQNDSNSIVSPEAFVSGNASIFTRVESTQYAECIQISELDLKVQNICDDIEVSLVSYWSAPRPGFNYKNKLVIKNKGESTVSSGTVVFEKDALLIYNSATGVSAGNTLTPSALGFSLDFVNLVAGAEEEIDIDMTVLAGASLGAMLTNSAEYTTVANDVYSENNNATLSEIIIGSYDPNDIMESQGPEIMHASFTADDYLYYTVRFQNVGTASAVNITIDNALDVKLDKTTFEMLHSSHTNIVERVFDKLTWQFYNINLADATNDEPNSHGFVYYKIKPLAGYSVGDIVPNSASIVFDFNTPIITNTFETEFVAALGFEDYTLTNYSVYPNPTSRVLQIDSKTTIAQIEIYNYLGQLVMKNENQKKIDVSKLPDGLYFVKIKDINGDNGMKKILKK